MTIKQWLGVTVLTGAFFLGSAATAQEEGEDQEAAAEAAKPAQAPPVARDTTDDYVAVWSIIEQQWEASQRGDRRWVERFLHDKFIGWPRNSPAPRDKASTRSWNEFDMKQTKGLTHELYPLSTIIIGDTAVAHYLFTEASEDSDGETEVVNGRYTDVLVRDEGEWRFIAWHGGADATDD